MVFSFLFVWAVYSPGGFHYGSKCNNTGIGSLYVDFCKMLVLATINHCLGLDITWVLWMVILLAFDICGVGSFLFPLLPSLEFFKCGETQCFASCVCYVSEI